MVKSDSGYREQTCPMSSHDPAPSSPGSLPPPPPHLQTIRGGHSVLVVGTSMVRHVAEHDGRTFCHPGARVAEVTSSALQLSAQHPSASTLVLEPGINDLKFQQSEVLKQDFISLVDRLLDTGKRLIISGPLPPPRYGDVITSRLRQLHLWLKGLDFKQHVTQLTHSRGRTLDLVITYGLSMGGSSVVDLAVSDHFCVFFNITSFNQRRAPVRTVSHNND
ncbi:hypothetical protein D4764_04G0013250 [Takifugu flavidus]|uniref:SGNH hydrolase-type esterase domain-containing protein n=1 Tax=Takifugu flavidus TaxID=433684 RepID=A0A5C6N7F6_9TELE|nr:hypothetical protein D4764_04G0013250 [Takifugu flavidus]